MVNEITIERDDMRAGYLLRGKKDVFVTDIALGFREPAHYEEY
jgi:hypothetical protein